MIRASKKFLIINYLYMKTVNQVFLEYVKENYWGLLSFFELDKEDIDKVSKMLLDYCQKSLDELINKNIESWEIKDRSDLESIVYWFVENIALLEIWMWEMNDISEIVDDIIRRSDKLSEDENWDLFIW